ncbi:hypothetical protein [Nocardia sp. NPDC050710]|uniref:hypothetical protein n=1 Tax=Nocardia sp. NPDC050710 TaxID=3157220 RepID=UPI0033D191A1
MATDEAVRNDRLDRRISEKGYTHQTLADAVNTMVEEQTGKPGGYTPTAISKLVCGTHTWPHKHHREALCAILDATAADLGFWNSRSKGNLGYKDPKEPDVRRNEFLRGLIAAPLAAALPPGLVETAAQPIETPAPTRIGMGHVDQVKAWAELFRAADDAGLGVAEGMAAQLRVAASYMRADMPGTVKDALKAAVATFHRVVGWARYDRGDHAQASTHFNAGWGYVEESGEWWLRAAILTSAARQAISLDKADGALTMLGVASVRADRLSLLRRADIAAVRARAHGKLGNDRECMRAVLEAQQLFSEAGDHPHPDSAHEGFGTYYTETLLTSDLAGGLFELAFGRGVEVNRTIDSLRTALQLTDEHARSRLLSTSRLAALQLRHGDLEEGVALGNQVIRRATGTTSARVIGDITRIYQVTEGRRIKTAPGVSELRHHAQTFLRTL